jgi:hypothetical protein
MRRSAVLLSFAGVLVAVLAVVGVYYLRSISVDRASSTITNTSGSGAAKPEANSGAAEAQPKLKQRGADGEAVSANPKDRAAKLPPPGSFGVLPTVPVNANANTLSVAEAARTGQHPERLTPMIAPPPFQKAAFERDPETYLNTIEPGRVYQGLPGGKDVPTIEAVGAVVATLTQNEKVKLKVKAAPNGPVTFTAFDGGVFPNKLASINVRADEKGQASTEYVPTAGVLNDVHILAGSPMCSGRALFTFRVIVK